MEMHAERLPASMLHEPTHALSERAAACPRRPSRPPLHARLARPTIGEDRVHLEQRAEVELQELGRQNSSTSSDSIGDDAGVLRQDDGAQDAAPRSQIMPVKVSKASVSSSYTRAAGRSQRCRAPCQNFGIREKKLVIWKTKLRDSRKRLVIGKTKLRDSRKGGVSSVYLRVSSWCIFSK